MIPGRENTIARDAQLTRNLGQRSSFVVTGVAKARVNVVAHDRQRRHAAAILIEVLLDGIGVLIVLSDQAERRKGILIERGPEPFAHPVHQAGNILAHAREQCFVRRFATVVPIRAGLVSGAFVKIDVPLDHDQEVRLDAQPRPGHPLHHARQIAPRVDDPLGALPLQVADQLLQIVRHRRVLEIRVQRSVKISRDELNRQRHGA